MTYLRSIRASQIAKSASLLKRLREIDDRMRPALLTVLIIAFTIARPAAACDPTEDCNRCLASAFGRCIARGNDPVCEARKKACQIAPPVVNAPLGPGGPLVPTPNLRNLVPARAYMRAADIPPPLVGAYGVVALRGTATSASRARLLMVCAAFKAYLPRTELLPSSVSVTDRMLTIWPLDNPTAPEAYEDNCDFVIDHYDLYGGMSAIQDAERQRPKLDGAGPFLIGWSPSNSRGIPDKLVLVVDLSLFESQDSFDKAFLFWQTKIVQDPMLWRNGFSIEGIRLAIRDFVDRYGQDMMTATKLLGLKN